VSAVQGLGGVIDLTDLADHRSDWVEPIKISYRGYDIVEMPPNNQGLAALVALNIVEGYRLCEIPHNSAEYLHCLIEAMKLALVDADNCIGDPDVALPINKILSKEYAHAQRAQISSHRTGKLNSTVENVHGDTAIVAVVDEQRNVVSMISSLFKAFGSGITVPRTGLLLHNRASGFKLDPDHPNSLAPGKRPYHTIMPAIIMRDDKPWACFGVVGGMMQPQGHLQLVSNLIDFGMNPQSALDAPRFRVLDGNGLALENGIAQSVRAKLEALGHEVRSSSNDEGFGGGQVLLLSDTVIYGGSDFRKDGCAIGY